MITISAIALWVSFVFGYSGAILIEDTKKINYGTVYKVGVDHNTGNTNNICLETGNGQN